MALARELKDMIDQAVKDIVESGWGAIEYENQQDELERILTMRTPQELPATEILTWDTNRPGQCSMAAERYVQLYDNGYRPFKLKADGTLGEPLEDFDMDLGSLVMQLDEKISEARKLEIKRQIKEFKSAKGTYYTGPIYYANTSSFTYSSEPRIQPIKPAVDYPAENPELNDRYKTAVALYAGDPETEVRPQFYMGVLVGYDIISRPGVDQVVKGYHPSIVMGPREPLGWSGQEKNEAEAELRIRGLIDRKLSVDWAEQEVKAFQKDYAIARQEMNEIQKRELAEGVARAKEQYEKVKKRVDENLAEMRGEKKPKPKRKGFLRR